MPFLVFLLRRIGRNILVYRHIGQTKYGLTRGFDGDCLSDELELRLGFDPMNRDTEREE